MAENKVNEDEFAAGTGGSEGVSDNTSGEKAEGTSGPNVELDPLDEAKQEIGELKDKYLRLYAEFENFRKRTSRERLELISTANAGVLKSMLPILDDFERARASFGGPGETLESVKEGIELIYAKFLRTLESEGLKPMEAKGQLFDADLHESVAQFPASSDDQKGKIVEVLEKGYFLNDKVIRYAKVVVAV